MFWKSKSCRVVFLSDIGQLCSSFGFLHCYFEDVSIAADCCKLKAKLKWTMTFATVWVEKAKPEKSRSKCKLLCILSIDYKLHQSLTQQNSFGTTIVQTF
ncbi:unnamed protein product [Lepidochelys olivacea]